MEGTGRPREGPEKPRAQEPEGGQRSPREGRGRGSTGKGGAERGEAQERAQGGPGKGRAQEGIYPREGTEKGGAQHRGRSEGGTREGKGRETNFDKTIITSKKFLQISKKIH